MSGIAVRAGEPGTAPGFFGKIPDKGDFVVRRLSRAFLDPWEAWLHAALEASRCQLTEAWLPAYLTSPIWRFALSAGLCGDAVVAGLIMPSVDRVGRYFPLVVAAALPDCANPAELPAAADDWFERAELLALSALEESFLFERFDLDVAAIGLPVWTSENEPAESAHSAAGGHSLRGGRVPVGLAANLARAYPLLVHRLLTAACRRYSLWWTTGSAQIEPSLLYCEELPPITGFAAFLDGQWERWGWTGAALPAAPL